MRRKTIKPDSHAYKCKDCGTKDGVKYLLTNSIKFLCWWRWENRTKAIAMNRSSKPAELSIRTRVQRRATTVNHASVRHIEAGMMNSKLWGRVIGFSGISMLTKLQHDVKVVLKAWLPPRKGPHLYSSQKRKNRESINSPSGQFWKATRSAQTFRQMKSAITSIVRWNDIWPAYESVNCWVYRVHTTLSEILPRI